MLGTVNSLGGAAIGWASSAQVCVEGPTGEAGYVDLDEGAKETLFFGRSVVVFVSRVKRIMRPGLKG